MRRKPCWKGWEAEAKRLKARKPEEGVGERSSSISLTSGTPHEPRLTFNAIKSLVDFRKNSLFHDAVLHLDDGKKVPVHKAILSACSPYFMTLFTTALTPRDRRNFQMSNISYKAMDLILDFAYSSEIIVNDQNVAELFNAADYMGIIPILELCCQYIKKMLNTNNCFGVLNFARQYKDPLCRDLALSAYRFIMDNFTLISQTSDEIVQLPKDEFKLVISADDLIVRNEEVVWHSIIRWISQDEINRKQFILELLMCVRLGMMHTEFFTENIKTHAWILENEEHKPYIVEILKKLYQLDHSKLVKKYDDLDTSEFSRPRIPDEVMLAIGGWSGGSATSCIEAYDAKADVWEAVPVADPMGPRAYHGTVVMGSNVYLIGGFDGQEQYYNSCRCFDAIRKEWREIAPMNCRRCYVSVAVIDSTVYAMGGYDGQFRRNTAEKYVVALNQWLMIAPMNVQRSDAGATALNGRVYITGGFDGAFCLRSAEVYDPVANQWTLIAPMKFKRSGVSCIAYHGFVYVLGGFNGTARMTSCEKYLPVSNTWAKVPHMFTPRSNFGVAVLEDMIFVVGGFNGVTTVYRVECFDDFSNHWYEAQDMHMYRSALSACVVQGLPNMIDYIPMPEKRLNEERRRTLLGLTSTKKGEK